eukprot:897954-Rhodomonas_salina.3
MMSGMDCTLTPPSCATTVYTPERVVYAIARKVPSCWFVMQPSGKKQGTMRCSGSFNWKKKSLAKAANGSHLAIFPYASRDRTMKVMVKPVVAVVSVVIVDAGAEAGPGVTARENGERTKKWRSRQRARGVGHNLARHGVVDLDQDDVSRLPPSAVRGHIGLRRQLRVSGQDAERESNTGLDGATVGVSRQRGSNDISHARDSIVLQVSGHCSLGRSDQDVCKICAAFLHDPVDQVAAILIVRHHRCDPAIRRSGEDVEDDNLATLRKVIRVPVSQPQESTDGAQDTADGERRETVVDERLGDVQVSRQHSKAVRHVDQQRAVQADGSKVVGGHRGHKRVPIHAQRNRVDGLGDSQGGV